MFHFHCAADNGVFEEDGCVIFSLLFVVTFFETIENKCGGASNKIYEYFSLCSLCLTFLKPQRAQRRNCIRQDLQICFHVFFVVTIFETTQGTEGEMHQTRSTNIFPCALRGCFF